MADPQATRLEARSRILRATLELVGRDGLAALSNRTIAREAGASLGTLTYHFDSQQGLLREALDLFLDEEVERLGVLTARLAEGPVRIADGAAALEAILVTEAQRRAAKMELYLQSARDPALRPSALRCFAAYDELAATALASMGIDNAETAAPLLVALVDGLQLRRLASGERELQIAAAVETFLTAMPRASPDSP